MANSSLILPAGAPVTDPGECLVNLKTDTLVVELTIRAPGSVVKQSVTLGVFQFISIFSQTMAAAGQHMENLSRQAAAQLGRSQ